MYLGCMFQPVDVYIHIYIYPDTYTYCQVYLDMCAHGPQRQFFVWGVTRPQQQYVGEGYRDLLRFMHQSSVFRFWPISL